MFSLGKNVTSGREEVFGINVFKVREVMHIPEITQAPDMPKAVEGMVSLRGSMVPVINLSEFCNLQAEEQPNILMITEYNKHVQGFLVHAVDTIERLNWDDVKAPPSMITSQMSGLVTAVSELQDKRLVMIMDVEKILAETAGFYEDQNIYSGIEPHKGRSSITVLFADDSSVARSQIKRTLDRMGILHIGVRNGAEAWDKLNELAEKSDADGVMITDTVNFILTDVEMPEMDGYVLTRKIKSDDRFKDIPVVMHSSLTAEANQCLGKGVGADAYVPKFEPKELAATLEGLLY